MKKYSRPVVFWCRLPIWAKMSISTYIILELFFAYMIFLRHGKPTYFGGTPETIMGYLGIGIVIVIGLAFYTKFVMAVWDSKNFPAQVFSAAFYGPYLWVYGALKFIVTYPCRHYHEIKKPVPQKKKNLNSEDELDFDEEWIWD